MTELERALVALGRELDIPAGPDLRSRVRERIERKPRRRRAVVLAVALLTALGLEGGKHVLMWSAASGEIRQMERRLAGNVLIWAEGNRTYRLEGGLNMGQMVELGRQITR